MARLRRTYTEEQRADVLALSDAIGPLRAARQVGMPYSTVALWRRMAGRPRRSPHDPVLRRAALRLSQDIGPMRAAMALRLPYHTVNKWRRLAKAPPLPPLGRFQPEAKCFWCGQPMDRPGLHTKNSDGEHCRREYFDDCKEEVNDVIR